MSIARFALLAIALVAIQVEQPAMARTLKPRMHHHPAHAPRQHATPAAVKPKPSMPHTLGSSGEVPPTKP